MSFEEVLRIIAWPLLGASAGAIVTLLYNRRLAGVKAAIDLHSEFHSDSFLKSLIEADKALKRLVVEQKQTTISAIFKLCSPEEWPHVSRVLHFFERLTCLRENGLVHPGTCDTLLGHYIDYFKNAYFSLLVEEPGDWLPLVQALRRIPTIHAKTSN
jgi:hypothetical protein